MTTTTERLRAAVEAALPCEHYAPGCLDYGHHHTSCPAHFFSPVLAAVLHIVEELERDRERLRDALKEACDEYEYAAKYKGDYLTAKHEDAAVLARLRAAIDAAMKGERDGSQ